MELFSEKLKDLRKLHGTTQKNIAQAINISERNYIRLENGIVSPTVDTLIRLAKHFNVSLNWLVGLSDKKELE